MVNAYVVVILSLSFLFLIHCLLFRRRGRSNGAQLPPSPPAIPFFGHLHLIENPLHAALSQLAERHGPVFSLRLGSRSAVVVSSPECARECLTENDVCFANRPRFPSQLPVSFDGTSLGNSNFGPHWRSLRRIASVHFLSAQRVGGMSGVISDEVRAMARRMYRAASVSPGGAARVQLKRRLFELSLSVLMEAVAQTKTTRQEADGTDADTDMSVEAQEYKHVLDELNPLLGAANLWDYLPALRWFDVFGTKRKIMTAVNKRNAFVRRLIDTERQRLDDDDDDGSSNGAKKSMISELLTLQKTEPEVYTDTVIMTLCTSLFTAGTDSTSTTIEWAMSLLLNHPKILKKAQAEIDSYVGNSRLIAAEDMPHLIYLQCIISETLRLYPVLPLLIPHESSGDCRVGGYDVPSGTMLLVNIVAVHRDPSVWKDAETFRPERFEDGMRDDGLLVMMPFGMGRRKCPGETLGLRVVGLALGTLIHCFDWERVDGVDVSMAEGGGLSMSKVVPLEAMCKPRDTMGDALGKLF
ncbi:cytochrome P450 81Q32-like [Oryza brachyantha]|uniref:cytochrome P450 81Q32-like n=1 Tax=Oryza brachyantha TaxID=4533 RepID=UPI001ADA5DE8|nr:cytochrome P450 81Q32-like [Oryza brachyantha]